MLDGYKYGNMEGSSLLESLLLQGGFEIDSSDDMLDGNKYDNTESSSLGGSLGS